MLIYTFKNNIHHKFNFLPYNNVVNGIRLGFVLVAFLYNLMGKNKGYWLYVYHYLSCSLVAIKCLLKDPTLITLQKLEEEKGKGDMGDINDAELCNASTFITLIRDFKFEF